jgi:acyl-CoA hydrolase
MASSRVPDGCTAFLGPVFSDTFSGAPPDGLSFESYGAIGKVAALARSGRVDIMPMHYSALSRAFGDGSLRADCVLLQLGSPEKGSGFHAGLGNDYALLAARHARLVIAEINPDVPHTPGSALPLDLPIHIAVKAAHPPQTFDAPAAGPVEQAIAAKVATLVPDRAVLQLGVGAIPHAILPQLAGHRDLGIHSGIALDGMVDLIEKGVVTNARKEIDRGVSVAGLLIGTRRLFDFAGTSGGIRLAPPAHTHGLDSIGRLSRFCALNAAVEVDLTGQVNSETAGGRHVGAVGGQVDFVRGANASRGGRAIIALPSTASGGTVSRIVPRVSTVTCARSDVDAIVTEWGVAELRGLTLSQRAEAMIRLAAPQFRETLSRDWRNGARSRHD